MLAAEWTAKNGYAPYCSDYAEGREAALEMSRERMDHAFFFVDFGMSDEMKEAKAYADKIGQPTRVHTLRDSPYWERRMIEGGVLEEDSPQF